MPGEVIPQVVMTLGRGYDVIQDEHGQDLYVPTRETKARADAAFDYYDRPGRGLYQDTLYLFSGWYGKVASRGRMPEPPEGISEAGLAEGVFTKKIQSAAAISRVWSRRPESTKNWSRP